MSKSLIKLVDLAIVPTMLLIFAKVAGILVMNATLDLSWDVRSLAGALFGFKMTYLSGDDLVLVISYSNFFMHLVALTGAVVALLKLSYLHPKHIKPSLVLRLAKSDKLNYINSTFHLYHEAIVWVIYLIISDILIILNYAQGLTYDSIFVFSIVSTLVTVFVLVRAADTDLAHHKLKLN